MTKYINADKLKDKIYELSEDDYYAPLDDYVDGLRQRTEGILDIIDEMPSEVVFDEIRCKDCKYFINFAEDYISVEDADGMCDFYDCGMKRLDFCSYAKRREANAD